MKVLLFFARGFSMALFLERLAELLWGPATLMIILGAGIYFSLGTRFLSLRKLKKAFSLVLKGEGEGEVSPFSALCTSLGATLGTGNVIGIATALAGGGPGALFWMVLTALLGMAIRYGEGVLAIAYRKKLPNGQFLGGPFFYLEKGARSPLLAKIFAAACLLCCLLSLGTTSQINGIATAATSLSGSGWGALLAGVGVCFFTGVALEGGFRRIARICSLLVPIMAAIFLFLILWILFQNAKEIPSALRLIFHSAFRPQAALSGIGGFSLQKAIRFGLGRGIFSNEAGMGSDPIAAACAKTASPHHQGLISMLGPFIDTVLLCSLTGLALVLTDVWADPSLSGAEITLAALQTLPLPKGFIALLYFLCLLFFGLASILGWSFYGSQSLLYLFPQKPPLKLFRFLFLSMLMLGALLPVGAVWSLADILCALMTFPNLLGLLLLSPEIFRAAKTAKI